MPTPESAHFDPVRMLAWRLLQRLGSSEAFADVLLDETYRKNPHLQPLDRSFIHELVLGTLRWRGRLDGAIQKALRSPEKKIDPRLLDLLRLGAYQILELDRVPDSAAVNESVRLAQSVFRNKRIAGFVNAVLRTIARNRGKEEFPPFEERPVEYISQALSHPGWLVAQWVEEFGPEITRKMGEADNRRPPLTVRANTLKISREGLREMFLARGIQSQPTPFSPEGLILPPSSWIPEEELLLQGFYFIQDESSQIVPHLLDPRAGERVLDACAAPGGKSTHLAQLMGNQGEIFSLDLHPSRIERIRENCRRMGVTMVKALAADGGRNLPFSRELIFDRILVDAPCTGLGTLHRNPEIRWRRRPEDAQRLSRLQGALLGHAASRLKPGGVIVYSTCTMTREENEGVVEAFLQERRDFMREDLRRIVPDSLLPLVDGKGFFRTYPQWVIGREDYRLDGFFAARLQNSSED